MLMKKPENLYDKKTGKQYKVFNQLDCIVDPVTSGTERLGIKIGAMKGETFICEDSGLYNLPLSYSAVAGSEGVLVYKISVAEALNIWPVECQNEVKIDILGKYQWFYERLLEIESALSDKTYKGGNLTIIPSTIAKNNALALEAARKVENHT